MERFHSRDQRPYWFAKTKDNFLHKMELISGGIAENTNMATVSLFWNTNMAALTSFENALFLIYYNMAESASGRGEANPVF